MLEDGWSVQRVARQVACSDLTVRRCWDQWAEETLFRRCPGSAASSLKVPVSSRIIARSLADGYLVFRRSLRVLSMTPTHRRLRLEWYRA
ncbi:transposable element Tcb2 transposase [Trichonephila clavipes]|nr:transposable element Tcb2 transposase [Trichonephila clavipes]